MLGKVVSVLMVFLVCFCIWQKTDAITVEEIESRGYVKVGIYPYLDPFTYYDDNKQYIGFDVDMIQEIAKILDFKIRFVYFSDFADMLPGLVTGKIDIWLGPITILPKRSKLVSFTMPYYNGGMRAVVRADNNEIKAHTDLVGKRVAVMPASSPLDAVNNINGAIPVIYENFNEMQQEVIKGTVDALVTDNPIAMVISRNKPELKTTGDVFTTEFYAYSVNKESTELLAEMNQAMILIRERGIFDGLLKKWGI